MKILIVNAYPDTYRGKKKFDEFVAIIREVNIRFIICLTKIFQNQKQSLLDMPEIIIRNRKNLDDYLYEPNTKFSDKDAEKVS